MGMIRITDLTFAHEGGTRNIFEHVSLRLDTDWKLGLIGRNGKGKTTFLKLLLGEYAHGGSISTPAHFAYFPFAVPDAALPVLDAATSICPDLQPWRLERELSLLDVAPEVLARPFSGLSGGERTKVLLAALFSREGGFPLIDEPTNHLDRHGRELVARYLRSRPGFILVSHDRAFLDQCIDHVLAINRADIEIQQGNYSSWKQNRDRADRFELNKQDKLKKDMKRLEEAAGRAAAWSGRAEKGKYGNGPVDRGFIGHKAAKMMQRAKSLEKRRQEAVAEKSGLLRNLEITESLKIWPLEHPSRVLAEAVELALWYREDKPLCRDLRFTLRRGERVALLGRNGCGKTTLLRLIAGEKVPHTGLFRRAGGLTVSYVPQDLSGLRGTLAGYARQYTLDENLFRAVLSRLDIQKDCWRKDLRDLSDGQRKKAALARSLSEQAHLYIWDEPLNFMDVPAREQIEELLTTSAPTMIFVEHDQAFVDTVATGTIAM